MFMRMKDSISQIIMVEIMLYVISACLVQLIVQRDDYTATTIPLFAFIVIGITVFYCREFGVSKNKLRAMVAMLMVPAISMRSEKMNDIVAIGIEGFAIVLAIVVLVLALFVLLQIAKGLPHVVSKSLAKEYKRQKQIRIEGAKLDAEGIMHCPKCNSTQLTVNPRGYSAGKAVVGAALFGVVGLVAGAIGNSKIKITCLHCGHGFSIKKK